MLNWVVSGASFYIVIIQKYGKLDISVWQKKQANSTIGAREKVFGEVGRYVGKALAQAVNLIFPEVILIDDLMWGKRFFKNKLYATVIPLGLPK